MTKQERNKIQNLESAAWGILCEAEYNYVRKHFPFCYGYAAAQLTEYMCKDSELRALSFSWHAYNLVAVELGVEQLYNARARKFSRLTWEWLEGIKQ